MPRAKRASSSSPIPTPCRMGRGFTWAGRVSGRRAGAAPGPPVSGPAAGSGPAVGPGPARMVSATGLPATAAQPDRQSRWQGDRQDDPERGQRGERALVGMIPGQVHHYPCYRSGRARGGSGPDVRPGRARGRGARRGGGAFLARPAAAARAGTGGHRLPVLHHAVQRRALLLAGRRERGGGEQDVVAVLHGRVVAIAKLRKPEAEVAGNLGVLDQPALDEVSRQRGVPELLHLLLAAAEHEVDKRAERPALRGGEVGGLGGALPWHDQVAVTGDRVVPRVPESVQLVQV